MSLKPQDTKLKSVIDHLKQKGMGFGFQQAKLDYRTKLPLTVLPYAWFDPGWLDDANTFFKTTKHTISCRTFHKGAFCFHWHNKWNVCIEEKSPFAQLVLELDLSLDSVIINSPSSSIQ